MKMCKHPNIIKLEQVFETPDEISVVMELMEGGELWDKIYVTKRFNEKEAIRITREILSAVDYLHDINIVQRDLKPENLLCTTKDANFSVKIADFGLAKIYKPGMEILTPCGTSGYVAPEKIPAVLDDGSIITNPYGKSVDIWSIGCIVYFLLVGKPPFYAHTESQINELVLKACWSIPNDIKLSDAAKEFIEGLLQPQPNKRFTAKQALNHRWIKETTTHLSNSAPDTQHDKSAPAKEDMSASKHENSHSAEEIKQLRTSLNANIDYVHRDGFHIPDAKQSSLWQKRQLKKAAVNNK